VTPWWGIVIGLSIGYIKWCLVPAIKEAKARRIRHEIDRIRGGYVDRFYIPNQPPTPSLRERILEHWRVWWPPVQPRTPEQVAEIAYRERARS
jgi:hypothetical protein